MQLFGVKMADTVHKNAWLDTKDGMTNDPKAVYLSMRSYCLTQLSPDIEKNVKQMFNYPIMCVIFIYFIPFWFYCWQRLAVRYKSIGCSTYIYVMYWSFILPPYCPCSHY